MDDTYERILRYLSELKLFVVELLQYLIKNFHISYLTFEEGKGLFVTALYRQRGRLSRRLVHSGMATLAAFGVMIAPVVAQEFPGRSVNPWEISSPSAVLSSATENPEIETLISNVRDKIILYSVTDGDTIKSIAQKFGVSEDTIRWQNNISRDKIKVGDTLEILPITGIAHKVQKGDTVYSIAKRYDTDPQAIVDFPFNTFANDETFDLAVGQTIIVPEGVMPSALPIAPRTRQLTPNAGTVVASGDFVWPASGTITQRFSWYHPGIDIANHSAPDILAADSGTVYVPPFMVGGFGNHVIIDHGNGFKTQYAHLQAIYVSSGQTVKRGDRIGRMGSTGRSTGTHLDFRVWSNGAAVNPLNVLR